MTWNIWPKKAHIIYLTAQIFLFFSEEKSFCKASEKKGNICVVKVACRVRVAYSKELNHQFFAVSLNKFLRHVFNVETK